MDQGVFATASELFEARHYPGVVALASDALEDQPECVPLLEIRARAHIALRRDHEAQADLRHIIRLDPQHALAYRLLGELAARRDEYESAGIFFREALRLDPSDREADDWLAIVELTSRPAAAAQILPAPAAAAGRFPLARGPIARARTGAEGSPRSLSSPARPSRFASGTESPDDERTTGAFPIDPRLGEPSTGEELDELVASEIPTFEKQRSARGSIPPPQLERAPPALLPLSVPPPVPVPVPVRPMTKSVSMPAPAPPQPQRARPATVPPRPIARPSAPELPGFGDFLVTEGILTRERLRAAQAYQRSMRVQLATAIVTLGLATTERIEWAAVAHKSRLGRR